MTEPETTDPPVRTRAEQIRDAIMLIILAIWLVFGALSVYQIFRDGSKVLENLPPFWFWGIPLAPFSALYTPWGSAVRAIASGPPQPPEPPAPPEPEGNP